MKIAVFVPSLRGGGAERMMANLAQNFAQRGVPTDLVLAAAEGPYLKNVAPEVNIVDLRASRVIKSLPNLVRYIRHERPAALLSTMGHANIVALWAKYLSGVPMRVIVREANTPSISSRQAELVRGRAIPALVHVFYRWADGIVAVSEGVAMDFASTFKIPLESIRVIHNPTVTPEMLAKATALVDHPWFVPGEPPVLLGVGRLTKQKDFPTLIQAFSLLRKCVHARLMILGEGKDRSQLEGLVRELGLEHDVALPGFVENPQAYMARSAVFVLSSAWEGFPNVLVEAMAAGAPVVATNCKSGSAEILDGGRYGKLVPVGDAAALSAAILETLNNPHGIDTLRSRAAEFTIERISDQYLEVLCGTR